MSHAGTSTLDYNGTRKSFRAARIAHTCLYTKHKGTEKENNNEKTHRVKEANRSENVKL
jgi:hypothetical protein